jgi:hypothetical protein
VERRCRSAHLQRQRPHGPDLRGRRRRFRPAPPGTQIGQDFGTCSAAGSTFAYGELVGSIAGGAHFGVGTDYTGTTATGGTLSLIYWDSCYGDDFGAIAATVTAVPEPGSLALMLTGVGIVAGLARRRPGRG